MIQRNLLFLKIILERIEFFILLFSFISNTLKFFCIKYKNVASFNDFTGEQVSNKMLI